MIVEMTYNSNAIEGSTLTLQETRLVLVDGVTSGGKLLTHYMDARNHRDAYEFMESVSRETRRIDQVLIQELHEKVMFGVDAYAGRYRDRNVRIVGARFTPPNPLKLVRLMDTFVEWLAATDVHPIEKAALAHYHLAEIHPFFDGNGRTARLLMNLILLRSGYPPTILRYSERHRYYSALRDANEDDPSTLINFVARAVEQSLNVYLEAHDIPREDDSNRLIPLKDALRLVDGGENLSVDYLGLLSRKGFLGATKMGGRWHITVEELQRYLDGHRPSPK